MTAVSQSFKTDLLGSIPSLRAFAVSLTQNADKADDLVQETLVKAWDKHESFQPGTNLKAWLFTILRNEFYSQMRKRGREVQDSDGIMTARLAVHPAQHGQLDLKDFRGALEQLPEDQREAIILIGASGFSYEEAADICGCAVGTIKSRVSRARTRLQEILKISGEDEYGPDAISAQVTGSNDQSDARKGCLDLVGVRMARSEDERHALLAQPRGKVERRSAAQHEVDNGRVELRNHILGLDFREVAGNHHVAGAIVAAQLLDIHGDQEFIFEDEDSQSVEQ